jgi:hypothetical protein
MSMSFLLKKQYTYIWSLAYATDCQLWKFVTGILFLQATPLKYFNNA